MLDMRSQCLKMLLLGVLGLAAAWGSLDTYSLRSRQDSSGMEVAARYHLRSRTSKFYQRSKTSQVRKSRAA